MKLAQSRQQQNAGRAQKQFSAVKKAASSVGSAISGAAKAVGSALKAKPIVRKPGQTSVRTRGGGAPQVAKPQQTQTQTTQPAPQAQQAQQTQAKPQGQSRFGKPQQPVKSPSEAGMGSGAEKARAMAKARIAAKNAGTAGPKLSGRERAQQMAKERIAAKNKSSNTAPSGSFGISAKGREQAAANRAEAGTPVRKVTSSTTQSGNTTSTQTNVQSGVKGGTTKDLTSSAGSLQKNKQKAKQLANNANKNAAMSGSGATTTVGKIDDF